MWLVDLLPVATPRGRGRGEVSIPLDPLLEDLGPPASFPPAPSPHLSRDAPAANEVWFRPGRVPVQPLLDQEVRHVPPPTPVRSSREDPQMSLRVRPLGGAMGCLVMILVSVVLSVVLTVLLNLLL